MPTLTPKQQQQVAALVDSWTDAKIARKFDLDAAAVKAFREARTAARRQKRERVFKVVLLAFPLLGIVLLELVLRLFAYGGNLALFLPKEEAPGFLRINENVGRRYFSAHEVLPETSNDVFLAVKPEKSYRIFVLGESSTFGYPYAHNGSMSKMLGQRLADHFPGRRLEIVNLGMPAINSFALLDLVDEMLAQRPDVLVIYAGHNEFYGALGAGSTESLGRSRGFINFYLQLQQFKLVLLLRDALTRLTSFLASAAENQPPPNTLMEQMVGESAIALGSASYQRAHEFFRANMLELVAAAQEEGVKVLLCELVSNVRDQEPFVSLYSPHTVHSDFLQALATGRGLEQAGKTPHALALYDSLATVDSQPALVHFRRGRCLEASGNYHAARTAYERARDLDGLRFRAGAEMNRILHEVAQTSKVPLVPMAAAFAAESPHGLVGKHLMLEHLHPNLRGYFIMGREIAAAMQQHGFLSDRWEASRPDSAYWQERGVTPLDEEVARIRIAALMNSWPFVPKTNTRPFVYTPRNEFEKLAFATWQRELTWEQAHVKQAETYTQQRLFTEAAREYEALIMETPYNVSPYVRAGLVYLAMGDQNRAYRRLAQSLEIEPTAEACKYLGSILVDRQQPAQGAPYLEKAAKLNPYDAQTLYNLAGAYLLLDNIENAAAALARLEKLSPQSKEVAELKQSLASLRATRGHDSE